MANVTLNVSSNPPVIWTRISRGLRFLLGSLIVVFSTTDLYTAAQSNKISFWLGIAMLVLQTFDIILGTKELKEDDVVEIPKKND